MPDAIVGAARVASSRTKGRRWKTTLAVAAIPLSVAALALPATATAGAGNINPWAPQSEDPNSNSTTFSQSEAVSVAQTFNILVAHNIAFTTADITAMKAANSKLK